MTEPETSSSAMGLSQAIRDLRREISEAMAAASGDPLQFKLGPVELELQVALTFKGGAKAEAKWLVVSIGGEASAERARTHTVKLTLTPQTAEGGDVNVAQEGVARPG